MNNRRHLNSIAARLSLRPPQRQALEILDRVTEIVPPKKSVDLDVALEAIRREYPTVADFEREFPSLCFALATGVGKTRLMGAFIAYLHLAHGHNNFFILAPNLTIYNKLITDFTPNTSKYVFKGITEFAINAPVVITGDTYEDGRGVRGTTLPGLQGDVHINIFNISKLNSEVRGGKAPRMRRLSEIVGDSYFNYLAELDDLVLLMDESHRYRASAGMRAINELKPVLGLELTATPFVETTRGAVPFRNVVQDYPLAKALVDGFVKQPAVVTRKDFSPIGISPEEIELMKLEDGIRLHEMVKVELRTYARETGNRVVKPFVLVIARDTYHTGELFRRIEGETFFGGRYLGRVLQVDSSKTGADEDEMVKKLLEVEDVDNPVEIVIHVNMLKEGWDVTNLYTIIPLRAANARILIEQSIGRGLRLPYGKRTSVVAVDRLNIVAHDKFQEIVDEANRPDSIIRMQQVILDPAEMVARPVTVIAQSQLETRLGLQPAQMLPDMQVAPVADPPLFVTPQEQQVAQLAYQAIRRLESRPEKLPGVASLQQPEIQAEVLLEVQSQYRPVQLEMEELAPPPNFAEIISRTTELVIQQTIDIPRILVLPKEEVRGQFLPFTLDTQIFRYPPPSEDLWLQHLAEDRREILSIGSAGGDESCLENYIVNQLIDFNDISYEDNSELLYDLATQTVQHFYTYLTEEETRRVLRMHKRDIARQIHSQMQEHYQEEEVEHEIKITRGFSALKASAYSTSATESPMNFRLSPTDKSNMARYLFGGFTRCLYSIQKFHSDSERFLAIILDREALKWFKPARGQFQMFYKQGPDHLEYIPDFVAETEDTIYLMEPKARNEMDDPIVLKKRDVAVKYCIAATNHSRTYNGKPWRYLLIPHTALNESMTIDGLARAYGN